MITTTITKKKVRTSIAIFNSILRALERIGFSLLSVPPYLAEQSDNWLEIEAQQALEHLMGNLKKQNISPVAKLYLQGEIKRSIQNRKDISRYINEHLEVIETTINQPIFIVGLPRTGTTALQNMLNQFHDRRALTLHELLYPARNTILSRTTTSLGALLLNYAAPEQRFIHAIGVDLPDECWRLFLNHFSTLVLASACSLHEYQDWMLQNTMESTYQYYHLQLQILQHQNPNKGLILKCPEHLWHLPTLFAQFPSAKVIWTHRDPYQAIPSYSSLISLSQRILYREYDPVQIGEHVTQIFKIGIDRALHFRDKSENDHFLDLHCSEIAKEPLQCINKVCGFLGRELGQNEKKNIQSWLNQQRTDSINAHQYSPEEFGIKRETITDLFQDYIDRFQLLG